MRVRRVQIALAALTVLISLGAPRRRLHHRHRQVRRQGPTKLRPLKMDADPGLREEAHALPVLSEMLVLGDGNTMGNIFVQVKSGVPDKDYPTPTEPVVLDQNGCQYKPHVAGVMVGQPFKILNSDGLLHNVHSLPKVNTSFNRAMPGNVKEAEFTFTRIEPIFKIKCDVHPWMGALHRRDEPPVLRRHRQGRQVRDRRTSRRHVRDRGLAREAPKTKTDAR